MNGPPHLVFLTNLPRNSHLRICAWETLKSLRIKRNKKKGSSLQGQQNGCWAECLGSCRTLLSLTAAPGFLTITFTPTKCELNIESTLTRHIPSIKIIARPVTPFSSLARLSMTTTNKARKCQSSTSLCSQAPMLSRKYTEPNDRSRIYLYLISYKQDHYWTCFFGGGRGKGTSRF